jgi:hypothetical protein
MQKRKKTAFLIFAVLTVALTTVGGLRSQAQSNQKKKAIAVLRKQGQTQASITQDDVNVNQLPVTDYNAPKSTDPKRKAKGERYKKRFPVPVSPSGAELPAQSTLHWWEGLSALPVTQSDAIVIGEVTDAEAHLADDKSGIYSEFSVRINEVLKDDSNHHLTGTVVAEREGGAIRLPDNHIKHFRLSEQGMPRIRKQYLFFLKSNGQGQDYTILTGYELRAGHVFPLDGAGGKLVFSRYTGSDQATFLNEVRNVIAQSLTRRSL